MMKDTPPSTLRMLGYSLAGVVGTLTLACCGPSYVAPPVTPQLVKISRAPSSELERGYTLHQAKCAKCHSFENPANYGIDELTHDVMPEMARKSKLDMAGEKAVLAYLLAARKLPPPEQPGTNPGS